MTRLIILFTILATIPSITRAQTANERNWQFSYYGDVIFHPGFQIGYQVPLKNWVKVKRKRNNTIRKNKSLNTGADLTYYWHKDHHHGFIVSPYLSYQKVNQKGNYFQLKFSLGYHRSFVDGVVYSGDESGAVESKRLAGQNTMYNAFSFDFGKDLRVTEDIPIRYFFQIGINGRYPYNNSYLPGIHTGIGIHYFLKSKR